MNWTKYDDRIKIKEAADALAQSRVGIARPSGVVRDLTEYDFNTPLELKDSLNDFWDEIEKPYMKDFILPVTVAAFKNRDESGQIEVSPFNYQF